MSREALHRHEKRLEDSPCFRLFRVRYYVTLRRFQPVVG
jgi:hypothetical protein